MYLFYKSENSEYNLNLVWFNKISIAFLWIWKRSRNQVVWTHAIKNIYVFYKSENSEYNLNLVWFNKVEKRFLCVEKVHQTGVQLPERPLSLNVMGAALKPLGHGGSMIPRDSRDAHWWCCKLIVYKLFIIQIIVSKLNILCFNKL